MAVINEKRAARKARIELKFIIFGRKELFSDN
jgi:hypothetical protein